MLKPLFSLLAAGVLALHPLPLHALTEDDFTDPAAGTEEQADAHMTWWREAHFGMFIHYGLYSGLGGEFRGHRCGAEWTQNNLQMASSLYAEEALPLFKPAPNCAEQWAMLAKTAGCRYVVLTSKHHEGFALFDTDTTDFCSQAKLGRDIVKEFTEACRANGLRVGLYHSVIDWHHPSYDYTIPCDLPYPKFQKQELEQNGIPRDQAAYIRYLHRQAEELTTKYGPIDILWWDYSGGEMQGERGWKASELMAACRKRRPGIIMNNRLFAYSGTDASQEQDEAAAERKDEGDFITPEQRVPEGGLDGQDWESCMTVGRNWGYNRYDTEIKSPATVIATLEECVAKGGNLLLNINPRGDGSVPEEVADVFRRVGDWMQVNGEAIYCATPVEGVTLPEGYRMVGVWDDLYIYLPQEKPEGDVLALRIPATELDAVAPEILGQPDCEVEMERLELPGEDEPEAWLEFSIPTAAWDDAVEGMPVLKLGAAS